MRKLGKSPQGGELLRHAFNPLIDDVPAKAAGDEVQVGSGVTSAGRQRSRKAFAYLIKPLHHGREDRLRLRPAANGEIIAFAHPLDAARQAVLRAMLQFAKLRE